MVQNQGIDKTEFAKEDIKLIQDFTMTLIVGQNDGHFNQIFGMEGELFKGKSKLHKNIEQELLNKINERNS